MDSGKGKDFIEKIEQRHPLLRFSLASQIQVQALLRTRKLIEDSIRFAKNYQGSLVLDGDFLQSYDLFWLWTLGAYEVVRTMCQNIECFDTELHSDLRELKRYLAELRMPFAKQELARNKHPVSREISVTEVHEQLGLAFEIRGVTYHSIEVMDKFTDFVLRIRREQILGRID